MAREGRAKWNSLTAVTEPHLCIVVDVFVIVVREGVSVGVGNDAKGSDGNLYNKRCALVPRVQCFFI